MKRLIASLLAVGALFEFTQGQTPPQVDYTAVSFDGDEVSEPIEIESKEISGTVRRVLDILNKGYRQIILPDGLHDIEVLDIGHNSLTKSCFALWINQSFLDNR